MKPIIVNDCQFKYAKYHHRHQQQQQQQHEHGQHHHQFHADNVQQRLLET